MSPSYTTFQRTLHGLLLRVATVTAIGALLGGEVANAQMMERMNAQANAAQGTAAAPAAAATATPNPDCTLIVPPNPLSATGLATPYQLTATNAGLGPCHEYNTAQSAFVQAAVIDPATGAVSVYNPLVIDKGTTPAAAPVIPNLPKNAIVALWFGFNGNNLTLSAANPTDLTNAKCINGSGGTVFGQFAHCNAPAFFKAANAAVANGQLTIPPLATAKDGQPCPTVRSFFVVDQDQSDNLPVKYLVTRAGKLAQYTQKNIAALAGAMVLSNPSDNGLVDGFMDPALGCSPVTAPDLADPGQKQPALPLNELQSRVGQPTPVALVPGGDPMTLLNGNVNLNKTNLYRQGADQPTAISLDNISTARYCRQLLRIAPARLFNGTTQALLANFTSPDAGAASNLFTFLAQRFVASYQNLNCPTEINQPDPVTITTSAGVATKATLNKAQYAASVAALASLANADNVADSAANSRLTSENAGSDVACSGANALPGPAAGYGIFIVGNGNLTTANTQSTGNVAVGGNAVISNYSVASGITGMPGQPVNPANIVVGGHLTATNGGVGANQSGTIYFSGSAPTLSGFTARGGAVSKSLIDFAGAASYYQNLSQGLGTLTANGTVAACDDSCLALSGSDPALNVFSVAGTQLAAANEINITAPQGSAVVINVTGKNASFQNGSVTETGVNGASVVYNFPSASTVNIGGGMNPMGTILAPFSTVVGGYGESTGQLIAAGFNGNISFEDVAFSCTLPSAQ